jgi:putative DNA primase/helicase
MGALKSENIPQELTARPQWVCWRPDKTPVDPKTGQNAKANDPGTWGGCQAVQHYQAHQGNGVAGVGFEFSQADPYVGIDPG